MGDHSGTQYWLFQVNPAVLRLRDALRSESLETLPVRAHKDKIKTGDRVIVWLSGEQAGCYALGRVTAGPDNRPLTAAERPFYRQAPPEGELRVALAVDYNLWYRPILREALPVTPAFASFNAGGPGVTLRATPGQYRELVALVEQQDLLREPELSYGPPEPPRHPLNLILYGPPGTGKTYQTLNHALAIIENRTLEELALESRDALRRRYVDYVERGQIVLVTFHPSFGYEDFVEGLKPEVADGQVRYAVQPGVLSLICQEARREPGRAHVLIIDEINRGNLAAIFGELITLLDPDKREGGPEALRVILPYSKRAFSLPANLYVVGTMNTTDRSAEALDVALRRRFAFRELPPDAALIPRLAREPLAAGVDLERLLRTINERIARLLDPDFCIGHGYLLDVATLDDLRRVFDRHIIPLLREYFFNDPGKLGLVLGSGFVRPAGHRDAPDVFAPFDHPLPVDLAERRRHELRPPAEWDERAFVQIYEAGS